MGYAALYWLTIRVGHGDALDLSLVVACQFLPMLLFSRKSGSIVAGRRAASVLVVTQSAQVAAALALGLPLVAGWAPIWYLCAAEFATGCVVAVDATARQAFMLDLVGRAELRRGTALHSTVTGIAKAFGPALAGGMIAMSGEAAVFLVDAASFLIAIAFLARAGSRVTSAASLDCSANPGYGEAAPARGIRWILDLPGSVRMVALAAVLIGGLGYQFEVTNPLIATSVFHLGSFGFGLLGTFMAVGAVCGSLYSARRPDPGTYEFLMWTCLFGAVELLTSVMPEVWAYDVGMVGMGAATALFANSAVVYVQQSASAAQRAHAVSAYNAGFMGFVPAGSFIAVGIAAFAGIRWSLAAPALLILLFTAAVFAAARVSARPRSSRPARA